MLNDAVPTRLVKRCRSAIRLAALTAGDSPVGSVAIRVLDKRAQARGIPVILRARGPEISVRLNLLEAIAYFRLLHRIAGGDLTRLRFWKNKLGPGEPTETEMWAVLQLAGFDVEGISLNGDRIELLDRLAEPIQRELEATTGDSVILDWIVSHDRYAVTDPQFQDVIRHRLELALQARRLEQARSASRPTLAERHSVVAALESIANTSGSQIFVAGTTLLAGITGFEPLDDGVMEFGTFAPVRSLADAVRAAGFEVERLTGHDLAILHRESGARARIDHYVAADGICAHDNGTVTRWHQSFELVRYQIDDVLCSIPSDHERYLEERFGNWRTPTLFFDDDFDSPCTAHNDSLEAFLSAFRIAQQAYATRDDRHHAYVASELLRDRFDLDVTRHLPQPPHPKVLSKPANASSIGDRSVVIVAGDFAEIDASAVTRWSRIVADDRFVIAAVRESGHDVLDRLATAKSLATFDHALLYDSDAELRDRIRDLGAEVLVLDHGSGVSVDFDAPTVIDLTNESVTAE